ncbi:single-stranded DNA-binding protein [bacterium]|nr:single-stranded DNA-binding protein [bacterium]
MYLNKIFILGHLTQDPQIRNLPSGQLVASFGVATNRFFYDKNRQKQKQTEFHNIVAFNRWAEIAQQYLRQGSMVLIEGRLQTRNWEDKNGVKRFRTEIIVENLQLGPKAPVSVQEEKENKEKTSFPSSEKEKKDEKEEIPTIEEEEINVKDLPL